MGGASRFIVLLATPFPLLYSSRPSSLLRFTHRLSSSSIVSLSTSRNHHTLTLTLSPISRPQLVVFPPKASQQIHTQTSSVKEDHAGDSLGFSSASPPRAYSHPWPEWSKLVDTLSARGYFDRQRFSAAEVHGTGAEDAFVVYEDLPEEFVCVASACLVFARDQPNLLGSLSRRDIELVVENGTPFLFKSALDTARRMRSFLGNNGNSALEFEKALTVDLMKYLLSYASNPSVASDRNNMYNGELVELSVRNLLSQLAEMSYRVPESGLSGSAQYPLADGYGQSPRPLGPQIEMKRGDWICPRCTFMNFARNVKCLECEEVRPQRQLTGGEWECPQCDFFNYGRNTVCLRCDCKRSGEASFGSTNTGPSLGYNSRADVDSRLAANEEKAQRWFSKVSLLDNASDLSKVADDEDFPEIMPLRKGENRFVVSTRKTPLERRLENSQYRRNLGNDESSEGNRIQTGGPNETLDTSINRSLDEILGHKTTVSDADNKIISGGENAGQPKSCNSSYVPFVPLPSNKFAKKPENLTVDRSEYGVIESRESLSSSASEPNLQFSEKPASPTDREEKEKEQAEKSERWFKKVAELHDVTDLASAISDDDFPEIMPMRKGENRFVVSKKKDRSMTSPMYKRRMALEQSGNSNFVPFVPFPPDYFAKKEIQLPDGADSTVKAEGESPSISAKLLEKSDDTRPGVSHMNSVQRRESQESNTVRGNSEVNGENVGERKSGTVFGTPVSGNITQKSSNFPQIRETSNVTGNARQPTETHDFRTGWTGKSLEGSAVKEIDPLDMSEEAKAERWFRRVAQIKDISELSQIPDEDFPSIMPMRKGVNRFVVSKRKTPLERRLTSPQYRRNLPIVNSEPMPMKKEDDKS